MRLGRRWTPTLSLPGVSKWAGRSAVSDNYWSSSTNAENPDNAQNVKLGHVNFQNGNVDNNDKDNHNYVRAVRTGT